MRRREFLGAGVSLAAVAPPTQPTKPAAAPPATQDDWQGVARVVAVGDVHGDKDALVAALRMANLVDQDERWSGGKAHLVQIGDIPSRGPQSRQAFDLLMRLEKEAASAGGKVHAIIGNHDAGVIHGDLRNVLPEEYGEFRKSDSETKLAAAYQMELESRRKAGRLPADPAELENIRKFWYETHPPGFVEHRKAFGPAGPYGSWIRRNNALVRINDTLFVHGGISPKYAKRGRTELNETIRRELADPERLLPGVCTDVLSPLWYRELAEGDQQQLGAHLQAVLQFHQVKRIVIGHTVTRSAILPRFGGRVVDIDLGLSRFFGRPPACAVFEQAAAYVLHRGVRIPLPGARPGELLQYLKAVDAADSQPSPVRRLLDELQDAGGVARP